MGGLYRLSSLLAGVRPITHIDAQAHAEFKVIEIVVFKRRPCLLLSVPSSGYGVVPVIQGDAVVRRTVAHSGDFHAHHIVPGEFLYLALLATGRKRPQLGDKQIRGE